VSNIAEIDDALSEALHALSAAQAVLRKGASTHDLDVLRKSDLIDALPRASRSDDVLAKLDEANRLLDRLEAGRDMDSQSLRKTHTIREAV
jgi:hypothetical protein